ncbi:MAG TPA: hypothetical protein VMD09_04210 [Solirubrobacteraceae bacterium]|nr:hypothetical protein [Solirubrobacteraceae bacterium]
MRAQNLKHLLAGALTALMLLIVVPTAVADPPPGQAAGSVAATVVAPADTSALDGATDPSTTTASDTGSGLSVVSTAAAPASSTNPAVPAASASSSAMSPSGSSAPAGSTNPAVPATPASSSATVQAIVQVQNLGCLAHCQGSSQSQSAQQTNLTIQPISPAQPGGPATGPAQSGSQTQTKLVQLQLGCVAHCFGSTTIAGGGAPQPPWSVGPPPTLPDPGSGGEQSVVHQSSLQLQEGLGLVSSQSQVATQVNASLHDVGSQLGLASTLLGGDTNDVLSALTSGDGAAASSPSPDGQAVSQVEQAIWQLQIGCLVFCTSTNQSQQAQQTNTTVGVTSDPAGLPQLPVSETNQLVWQLQIGCLFWCYDTVEIQTASIVNAVETVLAPNPPSAPSGAPGAGGGSPSADGGSGPPIPAVPAKTSLPLISSPSPGPISATIAGAPISGPVGPVRQAAVGAIKIGARLPASPSSPLPRQAGLLPNLDPGAAARPAVGVSPAVQRELMDRHRTRPHHSSAKTSSPAPPAFHGSPTESSWWPKALLGLAALLAVAILVFDVQRSWSGRVSG